MEKDTTNGQMAGHTLDNMPMIKKRVLEYTPGLTANSIKVIGAMVCRMELVASQIPRASQRLADGKKANE